MSHAPASRLHLAVYFANRSYRHEYDLTELDEQPGELQDLITSILKVASEELRQSCTCDCFVFVTCWNQRDLWDATTAFCCDELLSYRLTREYKEGKCCAGTFRVCFDQSRNCVLLSVYPKRQERKGGIARSTSKGGDSAATAKECWVAVDSTQRPHELKITSNGKAPQDRVWRAAMKVRWCLFDLMMYFLMYLAVFATKRVQVPNANHR